MAKILEMPKLSPTMEEGQLASWAKKEGDEVNVDDLLAEVETDKATMEFRAFDKGTLLKILVPAGSVVKLGQAVAILGEKGEDISALASQAGSGAAPKSEAKEEALSNEAETPPAATRRGAAAVPKRAPSPDGRPKASPYVRKLALERDVDLTVIHGTGPHGRIVARDLTSAAAVTKDVGVVVPRGEAERRPLSMMRKTIARRLTESKQTVPHFYLTADVDAEALVHLRESINADLASCTPKDQTPEKISINDLLIKACAIALVRVPECNAQFDGDAIVLHHRVDVSVAVAVPDGLVTPVLRDADQKGVLAIAREAKELVARAKAKKLAPEEMMNGTFSISNLGMFGIDEFAAVINPPEGAILAVGRVRDEPVVKNGAVAAGKRLAMTLSCDHRVIDGAAGARFLAALRALVERPTQILL